ncbi:MAG: nickel-binding protein [Nitrososphaeraceae archaeon]
MTRFLDSHSMTGFNEEALKKAQKASMDEFGVSHANILYNEKENKLFCLLDAPDRNSVDKHHQKLGVKCDWITEVNTTA